MTLLLMLLLKSFLVFALSGAVLLCLCRASASARHLVCLLTLSALLTLPLFSLTLPGWHLAGLSTSDPIPTLPMAAEKALPAPNNGGVRVGHAAAVTALAEAPAARSAPTPPLLGAGGHHFSWSLLLLALYLLGVVLAGLRPLIGLWGIARLRRACVSVTDARTLGVSADCAAALRLPRLPLLCRADVPVPMTWGGRRPVVLLPSVSETWPEDRLRSVLLHEMAHIKRRDWTCHRLADIACALYWFHPLVWLTARRLRSESEIACDDLVISSGIAAPDYARHLLEIAGALSRPLPSQSAIAMAQTPHIKRRILMVLDTTRRRTSPRRFLLLAATVVAATIVPLSMLQPGAKAQNASEAASSSSDDLVQIVGLRDINIHHTDRRWWQADGSLLTGEKPHSGLSRRFQKDLFSSTNVKNLMFAFHLSVIHPGEDVAFAPAGSQVFTYQADLHSSVWTMESTFPLPQKTTTIGVGIATRPWIAVAAHAPVRSGDAVVPSAYGSMVFSPIQNYPKNNWLMTVTTKTPKQDQPRQEWRVVAVDAQGRRLLPISFGPSGTSTRLRLMAYFDKSAPFRRVRRFLVETRPFAWTEVQNVALQPSGAAAVPPAAIPGITLAGTAAATARLHQLYGFIQTFRKHNGGAFPLWSMDELMGDMTSHPADYHLSDTQAPNYNQAVQYFTSPDSRFMTGGTLPSGAAHPNFIVYYVYDKRPDGTSVGTAKPAGTRDVFAFTNLYVRDYPDGALGFYLVLWDDGTVSQIPAAQALLVSEYQIDVTSKDTASDKKRWKQLAFPGQAGLPKV